MDEARWLVSRFVQIDRIILRLENSKKGVILTQRRANLSGVCVSGKCLYVSHYFAFEFALGLVEGLKMTIIIVVITLSVPARQVGTQTDRHSGLFVSFYAG